MIPIDNTMDGRNCEMEDINLSIKLVSSITPLGIPLFTQKTNKIKALYILMTVFDRTWEKKGF
jgi:hypothetical protein